MTLNDYLMDKGIKKYKFAEASGISIRTISKVCNGYKVTPFIAKTIEVFTKGSVKAADICRDLDGLNALSD